MKCDRLKTVFLCLNYPKYLVNFIIKSFVDSKVCGQQKLLSPSKETDNAVQVISPYDLGPDYMSRAGLVS